MSKKTKSPCHNQNRLLSARSNRTEDDEEGLEHDGDDSEPDRSDNLASIIPLLDQFELPTDQLRSLPQLMLLRLNQLIQKHPRASDLKAFEILKAIASPDLAPLIGPLENETDWKPASVISIHEFIQVRLDIPERLAGGQVLIFERDEEGLLTLLSLHSHTDGDIRFKDQARFPRMDLRTRVGLRGGHLRLLTPGRSELLGIIVKNPFLKLDRLSFFVEPPVSGDRPESRIPELEDKALLGVLHRLLKLDPTTWAVAANHVDIVNEESVPTHFLRRV